MELKYKDDEALIDRKPSSRIDYGDEPNIDIDLLKVCNIEPGKRYSSEDILVGAQHFLKMGANPNYKDVDGNSPIKLAIQNDNIKLVKLLLYSGATIPGEEENVEIHSEKIQKIIDNWPTTMGLLATREFRLGPDNEMDLSEYLDIRAMGKGKKRKSNKNKRKSTKRRK